MLKRAGELRIIASYVIVALLLSLFSFALIVQPAKAEPGTIYIRGDGSIDPLTAPISNLGNVTYTFTGNINNSDGIVVQRNNIIVDGAGYTIQGLGMGIGFYCSGTNNVTVKNTNIKGFDFGIRFDGISSNNTILENNITNNQFGTYLDRSSNNRLYHNNYINNTAQASAYLSYSNVWDNGYPSGGNYWSDNTGVDGKVSPHQDVPGSDGISDKPYTINASNLDRYPLMKPWTPKTSPSVYISVPYSRQITNYYCGPAALEMVFRFYGPNIPQIEIADVARTAPDGTYTPDMVRAAHFSNLSTSVGREMAGNITGYTARKFGYAAFERFGMTINELKSLIAEGYPIVVLTTWHFRVAVGFDNTHITFQDSYYGKMFNMTYENFDVDWDYSGHWGLFVRPWEIKVSTLGDISLGSVFNVTATITYPSLPFDNNQYLASMANATITLPVGMTLVSGETAKKTIATGSLTSGTSANVTWTVRTDALGNYTIFIEAEGKVAGFVPPLPSYPDSYEYDDRIGGLAHTSLDKIPPTTSDNYDNSWHNANFTIKLNATDGMSGIAETYYRINDDTIIKTVRADGQPSITTENADNKLEYWSIDNSGNEENHHILTGIKLDKSSPIIWSQERTPSGNVTSNQPVTIYANATDSLSGVKSVRLEYNVTSSPFSLDFPMNLNSTTGLFECTIPGQPAGALVKYKITAYDHAGNVLIDDNAGQYYTYTVVPEFQSVLMLPLLVAATLLATLVIKKERKAKAQ